MDYKEISIETSSAGLDVLTGILLILGVGGFVVEDPAEFAEFIDDPKPRWDYVEPELLALRDGVPKIKIYLPVNEQGALQEAAIREELLRIGSGGVLGSLSVEASTVREEDWANNWKRFFHPVEIGERLVIKPSWEDYDNKGARCVLEIDPAGSFGTGTHASTRLCLEFLDGMELSGARVLDLGVGSGILSIAALLLGAESAVGADLEQSARDTSRINALKNGFDSARFTSIIADVTDEGFGDVVGGGSFDVITANIAADAVMAVCGPARRLLSPSGTFICSGIIDARLEEVMDALRVAGYGSLTAAESEGWAAVMARV